MFVLIISITVHEFAHAKAAYLAGDDTAKQKGRLSLNPLDHLDPMGTIFMVMSSLAGFGIGWAKPVPVNPARFKHPRWDELRVAMWGPLSNLLLALVMGQLLRMFGPRLGPNDEYMLGLFVIINIALALFNLIPIAPLDGSHIFAALLPPEAAYKYQMFMARYGFTILIALIVLPGVAHVDVLGTILQRPALLVFRLVTGLDPFP